MDRLFDPSLIYIYTELDGYNMLTDGHAFIFINGNKFALRYNFVPIKC